MVFIAAFRRAIIEDRGSPLYMCGTYDTVTLSFFGGGAVIMKELRVLMPRWMCQRYMCIPYKRPSRLNAQGKSSVFVNKRPS